VLGEEAAPLGGALDLLLLVGGDLLGEVRVLEHGVLLDGSLYPYSPL